MCQQLWEHCEIFAIFAMAFELIANAIHRRIMAIH